MSNTPRDPQPLSVDQVYERLLELVEMVLFGRRNVREAARTLAARTRAEQERFVAAVELISRNSIELAYFFCRMAPPALQRLAPEDWQHWVLHLMSQYDLGGVRAAIVAMEHLDDYLEQARLARTGVDFESVAGLLERFVLGLNGRPLRPAQGERVYTDTETLYLPAMVARFGDPSINRLLYKAMAVHQWAQTWFGTWRMSLHKGLGHFDDPARALGLFHALETLRLDACIARELPGLYRETAALRDALPASRGWEAAAQRLQSPNATVADSWELLPALYRSGIPPFPCCYRGELLPEETEQTIAARGMRERQDLQRTLRQWIGEHDSARPEPAPPRPRPDQEQHLQARREPSSERPGSVKIELELDGQPVAPPDEVRRLLDSIVQDLGDVPDDYLVAAGPGAYAANEQAPEARTQAQSPADAPLCYDEWDYVRKQYRKQWCLLREGDVHPEWDDFAARTLRERRGMLQQLRRTFEALRGQDKRLKRQPFGDDIDIDAVVDDIAGQRAGLEAEERVFSQHQRVERDIAVLFMVDMSGSTKGWINNTERQALVLLCQALETLGDRYAIYGFSSYTHKRCESLRIKRFDEPLDATVEARIGGIRPREYTRMGVAIRHLSTVLEAVEARTKLLVTLSDGRPDDMDGYRGTYGIEDTRQALFEARSRGIHPFCITIDDQAMSYLPHMYGRYGFTVVDRLDKLPYKVSDVYRRLTM